MLAAVEKAFLLRHRAERPRAMQGLRRAAVREYTMAATAVLRRRFSVQLMTNCVTLSECSPADGARLLAQAREIFFETSLTKSFASPAARQAFLQRWFGNYADAYPGAFLLALDESGDVAGYIAGCPDSFAPASKTITGDIDYFTPSFRDALKNYPSHFHINVRPGLQGKGIGHTLATRVRGDLRAARLARHPRRHRRHLPGREILRSLRLQAGDALPRS